MDLEFYQTPAAFTRYLYVALQKRLPPTTADSRCSLGRVFEPCVGSGAISEALARYIPPSEWVTNDLDTRWKATDHGDATDAFCWSRVGDVDWTITNPPFTPALAIIQHALRASRVGVAMHLRASIHEVLKTGLRRTWMAEHTPTGILWLPRFAYQRSKTTGTWTTDSVCACWVIWLKNQAAAQFIEYSPEWVIDDLQAETSDYRTRMDQLMGYTGTEVERQAQRIAA